MLIDAGILPKTAAGLPSIVGASMIIGRTGTGYLLDNFPVSRVLALLYRGSEFCGCGFRVRHLGYDSPDRGSADRLDHRGRVRCA